MTTFSFILPSAPVPAVLGMVEDEDISDSAIGYELWQYQDLPRFEALLRVLAGLVQPLESLCFDVRRGVQLSYAVGVQLDMLGKIVGELRGTLTDAEFRELIRARIIANKSHGLVSEIYSAMACFVTETYRLTEYPPASYTVEALGVLYPSTLYRILDDMHPAGVGFGLVYSTYASSDTFRLSGTYAVEEYDATDGLGSTYSAGTGGHIAGVLA
jgi:hypothetical protein